MLEYTKTPTTATFSCTGAQTVAPKVHRSHDWLIQPTRYMDKSFKLLHLGVHKSTNDSNFLLYRDPDSSPKGPYAPWLIYSAGQIHGWIFLHSNYYTLEYTKTPTTSTFSCTGTQTVAPKGHMTLTDLFSRTDRWMNLFLHWNYYMLEYTKTPTTATFSCTGPRQ